MKYANGIGVIAAICMIVCCFFPWAYYPDLHENFTGFYTYQNQYGKPGKVFVFLSVISIVLILLPKIWSKRVNQFVCVVLFAYAFKSYMLYTGTYNAIHPQIKPGLIIMILAALIALISSLLSKVDLKLKPDSGSVKL